MRVGGLVVVRVPFRQLEEAGGGVPSDVALDELWVGRAVVAAGGMEGRVGRSCGGGGAVRLGGGGEDGGEDQIALVLQGGGHGGVGLIESGCGGVGCALVAEAAASLLLIVGGSAGRRGARQTWQARLFCINLNEILLAWVIKLYAPM